MNLQILISILSLSAFVSADSLFISCNVAGQTRKCDLTSHAGGQDSKKASLYQTLELSSSQTGYLWVLNVVAPGAGSSGDIASILKHRQINLADLSAKPQLLGECQQWKNQGGKNEFGLFDALSSQGLVEEVQNFKMQTPGPWAEDERHFYLVCNNNLGLVKSKKELAALCPARPIKAFTLGSQGPKHHDFHTAFYVDECGDSGSKSPKAVYLLQRPKNMAANGEFLVAHSQSEAYEQEEYDGMMTGMDIPKDAAGFPANAVGLLTGSQVGRVGSQGAQTIKAILRFLPLSELKARARRVLLAKPINLRELL